jgi:hypothetical protein
MAGGSFGMINSCAEFFFRDEELKVDRDFARYFVFFNDWRLFLVSELLIELLCVGVKMLVFASGGESLVVGDEVAFDFLENLRFRLMRIEVEMFEGFEFARVGDFREFPFFVGRKQYRLVLEIEVKRGSVGKFVR